MPSQKWAETGKGAEIAWLCDQGKRNMKICQEIWELGFFELAKSMLREVMVAVYRCKRLWGLGTIGFCLIWLSLIEQKGAVWSISVQMKQSRLTRVQQVWLCFVSVRHPDSPCSKAVAQQASCWRCHSRLQKVSSHILVTWPNPSLHMNTQERKEDSLAIGRLFA